MNTIQDEFLQTHAPDGVLTPAQAAQLLELVVGDTGLPETGDAPDVTPVAAQDPLDVQSTQASVLMAKDGVHTIDFQKLTDAREGERHWKAQAEAQATELQALRAEAQSRANAGQAPTVTDNAVAAATAAIDNGADPEVFGDFSEAALAKGIQTLMGREVAQLTAQMRGELAQLVQPLQQKQSVDEKQTHYQAIYAKHPDADSMAESKELTDWISKQPSFARTGYESMLQKGTTDEIIEFFDAFKSASGKTQVAGTVQADPKAAAKAAIARMPAAVPASLSDIPGGYAGPASKQAAMDLMSGPALLEAMQDMSPSQREAFLNRQL